MRPAIARIVLILAILFSGALAGGNIDRALVAMPAWQETGAVPWANFSRHADLGGGLVLYPVEAIGGALSILAAAIAFRFDQTTSRRVLVPICLALLFAAGGLLLTLKAAPIMLGINSDSEPAQLQQAFEGFWYWGNLRAVCQIAAFVALLLALPML